MKKSFNIITMILIIALMIIIVPFLSFGIGYFEGWILKITIGKYLIEGLTYLGINIPLEKLPLIFATVGVILGYIASIFRTNIKVNND